MSSCTDQVIINIELCRDATYSDSTPSCLWQKRWQLPEHSKRSASRQDHKGILHFIVHVPKALTPCHCMVYSCRLFLVRTDHESLCWLWSTARPCIARWAMAFSRDIATSPLNDMLEERISLHAELFHVSLDPPIGSPPIDIDARFPTLEELRDATAQEQERLVAKDGLLLITSNRIYDLFESAFPSHSVLDDQEHIKLAKACIVPCQQARRPFADILSTTDVNIRLAIDFVGPIHYQERIHYILTMQDTFRRFPRAMSQSKRHSSAPCRNIARGKRRLPLI
eukprot:Blabericola_migrator_1__2505@NODE_1704_length_3969_cov_17_599180_g478_i8_p2_GENE_NODE_1704_length_3969_cov_17_599180_g478_i8NODE_1704_length_3969_cov_17_599180_g478_i8_p2_ORF_typecomplete_len282_score17_00RT_RNaseH/PF17917_1/0_00088_NODE_1704_length_3969_cov_17_599180_g478_i816462491